VVDALALGHRRLRPASAVASYSLPRGFFGTARRERQIGIEASYKF